MILKRKALFLGDKMRLRDLTKNSHSYFKRLNGLFGKMSIKYQDLVNQYGLNCKDCPDNCCQTRFHNHTYIEYFFLMEGIAALSKNRRKDLSEKALSACDQIAECEASGETPRVMCPLNENTRCVLYDFRPMICRLHGIPYDLNMPGRDPFRGDGCTIFQDQFQNKPYFAFDRTTLYQSLSQLEGDLRAEIGRNNRIKMTVAEMLTHDFQ